MSEARRWWGGWGVFVGSSLQAQENAKRKRAKPPRFSRMVGGRGGWRELTGIVLAQRTQVLQVEAAEG